MVNRRRDEGDRDALFGLGTWFVLALALVSLLGVSMIGELSR
jgi:hypothetical protein